MEEAAVLAALSALVVKVIDFLRMLAALARREGEQLSGVLTQIAAWLGGWLVVTLAAHSNVLENMNVPVVGVPLGVLDGASVLLVGLMVASTGSFGIDVKQALDRSDSAAKPSLLKGGGGPVA